MNTTTPSQLLEVCAKLKTKFEFIWFNRLGPPKPPEKINTQKRVVRLGLLFEPLETDLGIVVCIAHQLSAIGAEPDLSEDRPEDIVEIVILNSEQSKEEDQPVRWVRAAVDLAEAIGDAETALKKLEKHMRYRILRALPPAEPSEADDAALETIMQPINTFTLQLRTALNELMPRVPLPGTAPSEPVRTNNND